ncbi:adenylyltransferase/cytidyltransferase family protein [Yoonia sediminilitoris]|uniref:Cytidyltransferase-like protein n=1 Tax=Yoonia sediminilitoris TaxID=1286148 RepID=A0A2T6KM12_9RHOB|nr:adenylyltransferase/cytidyltransferase family protein [Yoonia sediminilitoris]PUB17260.1 cytidyltransferase-like protein [Yoonia sediminilitoris]RCW97555.1 cytidyltransferase-like protein [Yoonia sediminilitoris]
MTIKQTLAVFIGRFQPFHLGHLDVTERTLEGADRILLLVDNSYRRRSWKNPFTYAERRALIRAGTGHLGKPVATLPFVDTLYNDRAWITNVRTTVTTPMRREGLDRTKLEKVKSGCDAAAAPWVPITEVTPDRLSEDHFDIIHAMVSEVPFAYSSILMAQG